MSAAPQHWVEEIQTILTKANAFPLAGAPPAFPWDAIAPKIASLLEVDELQLIPRKIERLSADQLTSGFGQGAALIALEIAPIPGRCFWMMGREEIARLTAHALHPSHHGKGFSSPKFQEGFYYSLVAEALLALNELGGLSVAMGTPASLPEEEAHCIDVEIKCPKHVFWGRLICPLSYLEAFKEHFRTLPPQPLSGSMAEEIDVSLKLDIGQSDLPRGQWNAVRVGDFVLLDRCTYDPQTRKGSVMLVLEETPLLRARIKDNNLKILDYASIREEDVPLETLEEEEPFDGQEEEPPVPSADSLRLMIEAGRLQLKLAHLLKLAPGEMLEFPVHPESGVDIFAGGKKIGAGELIRLGEMIGVKILQLG